MKTALPITIPADHVSAFCQKHHIAKMSIFGSAIHGDFREDSDIDILVEFEPGKTPGLEFFGMGEEVSGILNSRVDFNTPGFLNERFRDRVIREAVTLYVKA